MRGQLYTEVKSHFASSGMELEKGDNVVMVKEYNVESETGKKLKIINRLNPYEWIQAEHERLKKEFSSEKGQLVVIVIGSLLAIFLIDFLFSKSYRYIGCFLMLIVAVVDIVWHWSTVDSFIKLKKFEKSMINNMFKEDMEKSLIAYWDKDCAKDEALYFLRLPNCRVMDIDIINKGDNKEIKIVTVDDEGNIHEKNVGTKPTYNVNLTYPQITIVPQGIEIKFPYERESSFKREVTN